MRLREWIETFRFLHEKARSGRLPDAERATYHELREDFAALLLAGQCLTVAPGQTARSALRAVRPLPLELQLPAGVQRTVTLDLSAGGFSTFVPVAVPAGAEVRFTLALGSGPLTARARIRNVLDEGTSFRVSLKFEDLSAEQSDRVVTEVLDTALQQFEFFAAHG